ncbi:hypothetical protein QFZ75_004312 [Streptomyces sp. V3I8]|nr:hypothetical protein [Streptomyces sp. V3I8]MDQ1037896.1 hypothetical protein [Streptomyces sp. V3I8]
MSITQQYLLDTYRARRHGDPTPPAPGAHDWQAVRELRDQRRFRAVLAGRLARGRTRAAWGRLFGRLSRPGRLDRLGRFNRGGSLDRVGRSRRAGGGACPGISGERAPRTP